MWFARVFWLMMWELVGKEVREHKPIGSETDSSHHTDKHSGPRLAPEVDGPRLASA